MAFRQECEGRAETPLAAAQWRGWARSACAAASYRNQCLGDNVLETLDAIAEDYGAACKEYHPILRCARKREHRKMWKLPKTKVAAKKR